jgi:LemA protein
MTVLLIILAVLVGWGILTYNSLVSRKIATDNAWSQIDVQLKRRHDLIPNLVETVKGYAKHEASTLEAVIAARNSAVQVAGQGAATQGPAENVLSQTLGRLFALSESYPDLKANQNFLHLQEELTSTENRIGFARQHYNDSVGTYQTSLQAFPSNVIANWFKFEPRAFFELNEQETVQVQTPPSVAF